MLIQKESTETKIKNWFVEHKKKNHNEFGPISSNEFLRVELFLGFKNDSDDSANDPRCLNGLYFWTISGDTDNDSEDTEKYCFYKKNM